MSESAPQELLQPSLLDRLTDNEPTKNVESRDQRVLSFRQLKISVMRDLNWLLNTGNLEATEDLSSCPEIAESVLNYGVRDLTGITSSSLNAQEIEKSIHQAILRFEPRIIPHSLRVTANIDTKQSSQNAVTFEIVADMWAQPLPEHLYLQTKVDLETGNTEVVASAR
ncbi:MAG: type VI secretion system baseplate subunit TssE [Planctomycetota bacterium]|nr:type VI secretion system baseplate subunit TssE [Planctomycetota bacterium]